VVVRDYDVAYLPYCDGSLWSGDADVDADDDGATDYQFGGLMNLTASIDVIAETYPAPTRIFLTGNSAGGFGVHHALPLLRIHYPNVPIGMVNDSGLGISVPGAWEQANAYWNASTMYPQSCDDCIGDDGNLTGFHRYQLDHDPLLVPLEETPPPPEDACANPPSPRSVAIEAAFRQGQQDNATQLADLSDLWASRCSSGKRARLRTGSTTKEAAGHASVGDGGGDTGAAFALPRARKSQMLREVAARHRHEPRCLAPADPPPPLINDGGEAPRCIDSLGGGHRWRRAWLHRYGGAHG